MPISVENAWFLNRPKTLGPFGSDTAAILETLSTPSISGLGIGVNLFLASDNGKWETSAGRNLWSQAKILDVDRNVTHPPFFDVPLSINVRSISLGDVTSFIWAHISDTYAHAPQLNINKLYSVIGSFQFNSNILSSSAFSLFAECGNGRPNNQCGYEVKLLWNGTNWFVSLIDPSNNVVGSVKIDVGFGSGQLLTDTNIVVRLDAVRVSGTTKFNVSMNNIAQLSNLARTDADGDVLMGFGLTDFKYAALTLNTMFCTGFSYFGSR